MGLVAHVLQGHVPKPHVEKPRTEAAVNPEGFAWLYDLGSLTPCPLSPDSWNLASCLALGILKKGR